jgi:hypothetical protein
MAAAQTIFSMSTLWISFPSTIGARCEPSALRSHLADARSWLVVSRSPCPAMPQCSRHENAKRGARPRQWEDLRHSWFQLSLSLVTAMTRQ